MERVLILVFTNGSQQEIKDPTLMVIMTYLRNHFELNVKLFLTESCLDHLNVQGHILLVMNTSEKDDFRKIVGPKDLSRYYEPLMNECYKRRKRVVHVLVNTGFDYENLKMTRRIRKMFIFHDISETPPELLALKIRSGEGQDNFSSPGESFAWQLVAGFLCYILPHLSQRIKAHLLDEEGFVRPNVLTDHGVELAQPKQVLILPHYFLLLREQIVCNQVSVDMAPLELFPGCRRIGKAASPFFLEFDSPGYKKRIAGYMLELKEPLMQRKDSSTFTHVIIFVGYAAPMFVMQKLDMSNEDKKAMLRDFAAELNFIIRHPKASQMLYEFSDDQSILSSTEFGPQILQLVDVADECSIESAILDRARAHLMSLDGVTSISQNLRELSVQQGEDNTLIEADYPLMSMAFAMAANSYVGFAMLLRESLESLISSGQQLPFDLPYCFVVPKSGRYPDEAKLYSLFQESGVATQQQQFQSASGRRYTYRIHTWQSRRMAFEVPPSVSSIRRQAEIGVCGVRSGDLPCHLAEFKAELEKFVSGDRGNFKVVEWDDITGFRDNEGSKPSVQFALSLLDCVFSAGT